jgi:hypothetical protein
LCHRFKQFKPFLLENVLNDIEGVDFMKARTGFVKDEDHANIVLLVDELGGLRLALEQAAAHIKL